MANFKAVVRGELKDGFMQVYIRVTHRRSHGYIKTDKMITRHELTGKVIAEFNKDKSYTTELTSEVV